MDELTGADNRRHVLAEFEPHLANYIRYGSAFSLISMDIDHFKAVNDSYGHLVGDDVLKRFSEIVSERIRRTDIFARTGGEEFLILMPHTTRQFQMLIFWQRDLEKRWRPSGSKLPITNISRLLSAPEL
ncbi:GGDEF domain-containing protein [Marinobacter maroccanus]|uniref:GGDEF domain-containing protein n=1 Tax=Marinobacter maroccanus TaxID=2055143 RepID=UPI003BB11BCD